MQVAPSNACPCDPENSIEDKAVIPRAAPAARAALNHERLTQALLALGSASFFVYAAHEPLLMVLRMLAYSNIPLDAPYTVLAIYLLLPALVIAFLVLCHGVLKRTCPRLLGLITGGR